MSSTIIPARRFRFAPVLTATVLTVLLLWLVGAAADIFLLLFLGILISLYLGAVTDFFVRWLRIHDYHAPRWVAFLLALTLTLSALVGLFWLLIPPVIAQTRQLVGVLPTYIQGWEAWIEQIPQRIPALAGTIKPGEHRIASALYEQVTHLFDSLAPKVAAGFHAFINGFAVAVTAIYLALQPGVYREGLIRAFPPVHRDLVRDVLGDLARDLRNYIVAQLTAMAILALLTAVGLYLLKVPYWLTFGIFTGAVAVVPFFGTLVSTVLPALFVLSGPGFFAFGPVGHALLVVLLGVVVHIFEGNVVVPLITAGRVHLPPVLTIMGVLVMGKLLGPVGLLVAVPTLVVLKVIVQRILISRIYEGQGFRRTPRDRILTLRVPAPDGGVVLPDGPAVDIVAISEREAERSGMERKIA